MSTLMKFVYGTDVLQFTEGASYPASRPIEKVQIADRTASGDLQIEELGVSLRRRVLNFENMLKADYDALRNWFDNIVNGAEHIFEFTDERGEINDVRFIDLTFDFPEDDFELYSGSITLEYQ